MLRLTRCQAAGLLAIAGFVACGTVEHGSAQPPPSQELEASRSGVLISPEQDFGTLLVVPPCKTELPHWVPASPRVAAHYSSVAFTVEPRPGSRSIATGRLGSALQLPPGDYAVVMNDTEFPVHITRGGSSTVYAQRIDVAKTSLAGTSYQLHVLDSGEGRLASRPAVHYESPCPCGTLFHRVDFPVGVGLVVLPGSYRLEFSYSGAVTQSIAVSLPNALEVLPDGASCDGVAIDGGTATLPASDAGATSVDGGAPVQPPELCINGVCPDDTCTRENCPHGCCDTVWEHPRWCRAPGEACSPLFMGEVCNPRTLMCE